MSKKKSNKKKDKMECRNFNSQRDYGSCGNCAVDMASLEAYTDQRMKEIWDAMPQKEKNKILMISALQKICGFGFVSTLITTFGLILFQFVNGYEIISLIDTLLYGILVAFIFAFIIKMSDESHF